MSFSLSLLSSLFFPDEFDLKYIVLNYVILRFVIVVVIVVVAANLFNDLILFSAADINRYIYFLLRDYSLSTRSTRRATASKLILHQLFNTASAGRSREYGYTTSEDLCSPVLTLERSRIRNGDIVYLLGTCLTREYRTEALMAV